MYDASHLSRIYARPARTLMIPIRNIQKKDLKTTMTDLCLRPALFNACVHKINGLSTQDGHTVDQLAVLTLHQSLSK